MKIMLCTLVLNEMEHLANLYEQHKDWPGLVRWVFVESADRVYAETNPDMVSPDGLSTDGTSAFLSDLAARDPRVTYIPFGFCGHTDPAQGKCESRSAYLTEANKYQPGFLFVLDADEFYTHEDQGRINTLMKTSPRKFTAFCFKHRHPWRPPSITDASRFLYEVRGGFWDIPLCRGWRWQPGLRYHTNHNTPETKAGQLLDATMKRFDKESDHPECVHLAFTSDAKTRHAKNAYYAARGEGRTDFRGWYVESRAAYETWKPGDRLPRKAEVLFYHGPIPEVFQER